jgi:hypothetical protein
MMLVKALVAFGLILGTLVGGGFTFQESDPIPHCLPCSKPK